MREEEAKLAGKKFRPAIEPPYRWRDWAAKPDGITGPGTDRVHQPGRSGPAGWEDAAQDCSPICARSRAPTATGAM